MKRFDIVVIIFAVIGAFLLSLFVKYQFTSPDAFSSTEKSINFELSDLYTSAGNRSLTRDYCGDILIISADKSNRDQIAATIKALDEMEAKVIGIDISFPSRQDNDSHLISVLQSCHQTVLPYHLEIKDDSEHYVISDTSYFFADLPEKHYGADNIGGSTIRSTIRVFKPFFKISDTTVVDSFAAAIVKLYSPDSYENLKSRNTDLNRIRFHGIDIDCLHWTDIISNDSIPQTLRTHEELIKDRIVLIGHTNSNTDLHTTPIDVETPGVFIHAYTINTILKELYTKQSSEFVNYLIALIVTLLFCTFVYYIKANVDGIGEIIIRICQFLLMILFFIIGTILYLKHSIFVNFSLSLLMIGFSMLMLDIASGIYWIYKKTIKHIKNMNAKLIVIPICFLLISNSLAGQSRLSIYNVSKGVGHKSQDAKEWQNATKRMKLNQTDLLMIPADASVSILDIRTSHTYNYTAKSTNTLSVTEIIKHVQNNERGVFRKLIQELIANSKVEQIIVRFKSRGVTTMSKVSIEKEICSKVYDFMDAKTRDKRKYVSPQISLSKIKQDKGYIFQVTNNTKTGFYFNILKIDQNGVYVCYNIHEQQDNTIKEVSLYLKPGGTFKLPGYDFFPEKKSEYIVIASKNEFSWSLLDEHLNDPDFQKGYYDNESYKIGIE